MDVKTTKFIPAEVIIDEDRVIVNGQDFTSSLTSHSLKIHTPTDSDLLTVEMTILAKSVTLGDHRLDHLDQAHEERKKQ